MSDEKIERIQPLNALHLVTDIKLINYTTILISPIKPNIAMMIIVGLSWTIN